MLRFWGVVVMEKEYTEVSGLQTKITPEPRGERGQCLGDPEGKTVSIYLSVAVTQGFMN